MHRDTKRKEKGSEAERREAAEEESRMWDVAERAEQARREHEEEAAEARRRKAERQEEHEAEHEAHDAREPEENGATPAVTVHIPGLTDGDDIAGEEAEEARRKQEVEVEQARRKQEEEAEAERRRAETAGGESVRDAVAEADKNAQDTAAAAKEAADAAWKAAEERARQDAKEKGNVWASSGIEGRSSKQAADWEAARSQVAADEAATRELEDSTLQPENPWSHYRLGADDGPTE